LWRLAARRVRDGVATRKVPLLAISAAFSFLIMMFNIPLPGGTTGHAVGGVLIAIAVGPWGAMLSVSIALAIQALLFGDGGVTALGANCFNIAFVMPFVGHGAYRVLCRRFPSERGGAGAAGMGGWVGLNSAAFTTALMFGIQPWLHRAADGRALYAPYGLSVAVPAMTLEHLLLFGVVEGIVTGLVFHYLQRSSTAWILSSSPNEGLP
jgi:cobalt/nickel transport system permease protein